MIRILIHPVQDDVLHSAVIEALNAAIADDSDHYDYVTGVPGVIDHYGYHDSLRSGVVLSEEYDTQYKRLIIRDIDDSTHETLRALIASLVTS